VIETKTQEDETIWAGRRRRKEEGESKERQIILKGATRGGNEGDG